MDEIQRETIELPTSDGPMTAYLAQPSGAPLGGVVVVQEAFGLTGHIHEVVDSLASEGFLAIAPALFHRSEQQVFGYDDYKTLGPVVMGLTREMITIDIDAALAELERRGHPASAQAIIGFCMGGTVALATAARLRIVAAVTFYGGGITDERFGLDSGLTCGAKLCTPWMGFYGDLDANISIDAVEQLREAAATSAVPTKVIRYADADHGFHRKGQPSFQAEASADAWRSTVEFLSTNLTAAPPTR